MPVAFRVAGWGVVGTADKERCAAFPRWSEPAGLDECCLKSFDLAQEWFQHGFPDRDAAGADWSALCRVLRPRRRREHRENLRQQGCRVLETGEKEAAAAFRKRADDEFDAKVEATVEKEIEAMPSEKREKLYAEMTRGGADVEILRGTAQ